MSDKILSNAIVSVIVSFKYYRKCYIVSLKCYSKSDSATQML